MRIAVLGASGFVGSAVYEELVRAGHDVVPVRAPRVTLSASGGTDRPDVQCVASLREQFDNLDAVINCSGNPDASETDSSVLFRANALSPALVARAAAESSVARLVHLSSAVVQGRKEVLDETLYTEEFSAYAQSKAEGERLVLAEFPKATIYRPPSVHAAGRRVTTMVSKLASSPFSTVARPGTQPTPQALLANVAAAISFLATTTSAPPTVVIHPWEGLQCANLMEYLGGKRPLLLPHWLAKATCSILQVAGRRIPALAANVRRVEMLWFGQAQSESWLTRVGWTPPFGRDSWDELGELHRKRA